MLHRGAPILARMNGGDAAPAAAPPTEEGRMARRIVEAAPGRDPEAESVLCRRLGPRLRLYGLRHLR